MSGPSGPGLRNWLGGSLDAVVALLGGQAGFTDTVGNGPGGGVSDGVTLVSAVAVPEGVVVGSSGDSTAASSSSSGGVCSDSVGSGEGVTGSALTTAPLTVAPSGG